jgi:tRNA nucleotidyltransferase/poly(A) polymerase
MGPAKNNALIDEDIFFILDLIENSGYEARLVGGAVRNFLLERPISDIDMATSATPPEIIDIFRRQGLRVIPSGIAHGSVSVPHNGRVYEITTLREDVKTFGRHAEVKFSKSFRTDSERRDFTMNAIYADKYGKIYDYHSGIKDALAGNVRFIGNPEQRIGEDYLRIFRYFRFVAGYGNCICNPEYAEIISRLKSGVRIVSGERIVSELLKTFEMPDSHRIVPPMREVADELFSLRFDSLNACARLGIFDSMSETERLAMLLKFSELTDLADRYNFPKGIRDMLLLQPVDRRQIFVTLKQLRKNLRIFYAKFRTADEYLRGTCSAAEAKNVFKELSDFCESEYADFSLRADDLRGYNLTKVELGKVMAAVKKSWATADRLSVDECKKLAAEAIRSL